MLTVCEKEVTRHNLFTQCSQQPSEVMNYITISSWR